MLRIQHNCAKVNSFGFFRRTLISTHSTTTTTASSHCRKSSSSTTRQVSPSPYPFSWPVSTQQHYLFSSQHTRRLHTTRTLSMASDEDYMAFLNKANQDTGATTTTTTNQSAGQQQFKTTDSGEQVPRVITDALRDAFYVSETDEPFKGVSLKYAGDNSMPDEVEFAKLIEHGSPEDAGIEIMDPTDWDRQGEYMNLVEAVRMATEGNDVRVYRVPRDSTRVEYWLISVKDGRAVGVKALAVES